MNMGWICQTLLENKLIESHFMSWLTITSISKSIAGQSVLSNFNWKLEKGVRLGIAGETGSGKTTLLKIMAGLVQPDSGTVTLEGEKILGPDEKLLPGHPDIAYLSQHFELLNNYRVEEVLDLKNWVSPEEANKIYRLCQIEHLLHRKTTAISGGERQRIALARALVSNPKLLLLDEPFSNLDPGHKRAMKQLLSSLEEQVGVTLVMVSHDGSDLLSWAHTLLLLRQGQIVQHGSPELVYASPVDAYCAGLMGEYSPLWIDEKGLLSTQNEPGNELRFFRPEELMLFAQEEPYTIRATVEEVLFVGGYYLVQVKIGQHIATIRQIANEYKPGEKVFLGVC